MKTEQIHKKRGDNQESEVFGDAFTLSMTGFVSVKSGAFAASVQFVWPSENNAICCPMIHWHWKCDFFLLCASCSTFYYELYWECKSKPTTRNKLKTQRSPGTSNSRQLMVGKPDRTKWSESKPQSGLKLSFFFMCSLLVETYTELNLQDLVWHWVWLSTNTTISNLAGWHVTKTPDNWATCGFIWVLLTCSSSLGIGQRETKYHRATIQLSWQEKGFFVSMMGCDHTLFDVGPQLCNRPYSTQLYALHI